MSIFVNIAYNLLNAGDAPHRHRRREKPYGESNYEAERTHWLSCAQMLSWNAFKVTHLQMRVRLETIR